MPSLCYQMISLLVVASSLLAKYTSCLLPRGVRDNQEEGDVVFFVSSMLVVVVLVVFFSVFLRCYQHKSKELQLCREIQNRILFGVIEEGKKGGLSDLSSKLQ